MKDNEQKDNKFWDNFDNNTLDEIYTGWKDKDEKLNNNMYLLGSCKQNNIKEKQIKQIEQVVTSVLLLVQDGLIIVQMELIK